MPLFPVLGLLFWLALFYALSKDYPFFGVLFYGMLIFLGLGILSIFLELLEKTARLIWPDQEKEIKLCEPPKIPENLKFEKKKS